MKPNVSSFSLETETSQFRKQPDIDLPIFKLFSQVEKKSRNSQKDIEPDLDYVKAIIKEANDINSIHELINLYCMSQNEEIHKIIYGVFFDVLVRPLEFIKKQSTIRRQRSNSGNFSSLENNSTGRRIRMRSASLYFSELTTSNEDGSESKNYCILQYVLDFLPVIYHFSNEEEKNFFVQILPSVLLSLTPSSSIMIKNEIPDYSIYRKATQTACKLIRYMTKEYTTTFLKLLIDTVFIIIFNVFEYNAKNNCDQRELVNYIGDIMPVISDCITSDVEGFDIDRSLQGFWIALLVQSGGDIMNTFSKWKNSLMRLAMRTKPFISNTESSSYNKSASLINDITNRIKQRLFNNSDDIAIVFKSIAPQICPTAVPLLSVTDAVFVLSIFTLEKVRAMNGCIDYFFDFCDVDVSPTVNQCIDSMVDPILNCFMSSVNILEDSERVHEICSVAMKLLNGFLTPGSRRATITYMVAQKFFRSNILCIMSPDFIGALVETAVSVNPQQQPLFFEIANEMISTASYVAPAILYASATKVIINKIDSPSEFYLSFFLERIPSCFKADFLKVYSKLCITYGMGISMKEEPQDCGNDRKAEYITLKIINTQDITLIEKIPSDITIATALRCWGMIVTTSIVLASELVNYLFLKFSKMVYKSKGIFSDTYNEADVRKETAILIFFTYLLKLNIFTYKIAPLAAVMENKVILRTAGAINALIPLSSFMLAVLSLKPVCEVTRNQNIVFTITVLLKVLSMRSIPDVYKFITLVDLVMLEKNIKSMNVLSKVFKETIDLPTQHNPSDIIKLDAVLFEKLISVLKFLLSQENMLFSIFVSPLKYHKSATNLINKNWVKPKYYYVNELLPVLATLEPASIFSFITILHAQPIFQQELPSLSQRFQSELASESELVPELANNCVSLLSLAPTLEPHYAITLIKPSLLKDVFTSKFIIRCLNRISEEDALMIVPQLMQANKFDEVNAMNDFIIDYASKHELFSHRVLWIINDEKSKNRENEKYVKKLIDLEKTINKNYTLEQKIRKDNEFELIDDLAEISRLLLQMKLEDRKNGLQEALKTVLVEKGMYVPSRPEYEIISINPESSRPLKSHSRVPILVDFKVKDKKENIFNYSCIFKIHDDVRMDALMIQLIDKFGEIFKESGIDAYVCPYKVFTTGEDRGVIECIEHASSRHDIGVETGTPLLNYFTRKYGPIGTPSFCKAQDNFIKSLAPYSLICYIFQVKDRHNANIMIDDDGHVIHIDFGFIFDISPGGNIKFERAPFKLTREYIDLLGGSREAAPFKRFASLLSQCFVAVQARHSEIEAICELMTNAKLPCFRPDSLRKLRERFAIDRSASEIPDYISSLIYGSYEAITTTAYDSFQNSQNAIFY